MVDEHFSDAVIVDYLVPRERRLINGIPIDEFVDEKYHKLPKGWSWNTELFKITYEDLTDEEKNYTFEIDNPCSIKAAYDKRFLVKDKTIFHGIVEEEITKDGYRIVKKYPACLHHIDHVSIYPFKVYDNYQDAKNEVDKNIQIFIDQAAMSDYEWSVLHIKKKVDKWKVLNSTSDGEAKQYLEWLLNLDDVENIETRINQCQIQWKHCGNKRWNYIELGTII